MGSNLIPDVRCEATNEIVDQHLSAAKARRVLNWRPRFTLDDGLRRTIAWYTAFLQAQTAGDDAESSGLVAKV
jgi:CDP-glucose 4,6-dehydratase